MLKSKYFEEHFKKNLDSYKKQLTTANFDPNMNIHPLIGSNTADMIIFEVLELNQISTETLTGVMKVMSIFIQF